MVLMLIDDDKDDQDLFCEAVSEVNRSAKCLIAKDGKEAIDILSQHKVKPDYIFLDINMPRMDGRECMVILKRNPKLKDIPVIVLSTAIQKPDRDYFKELGAKELLLKPQNFAKLIADIKYILEN